MLKRILLILTCFLATSALDEGERSEGALPELDSRSGTARDVLQLFRRTNDERFVCELRRAEILELLDETTRVWRVDDTALRDVDDDLQVIVNCSEEGDTILLDLDDIVQFPNRVVIPWHLTLSGNVPEARFEDGVFPETRRKQRIGCPRDDEGVFFVRARDVLLANIIFEDCYLTSAEGSTAIVGVEACNDEGVAGNVQLHHVNFVGNRLQGSTAVNMSSVSCSSLELVDVEFENNTCTGSCGAVMSTENELRQVRVRGTVQVGEVRTVSAVLYAPPNSRTTAENITAVDNEGVVLHVDHGELEISDCEFLRNGGIVDGDGLPYSSAIHLNNASATVRRCTFEDNVALEGAAIHASGSNVTLRSSFFNRNKAENRGAAVYFFQCEMVEVTDCSFTENSLPVFDGAGIFSNATKSLALKRSTFQSNSAGTGGAVYVVDGPLDAEYCDFLNNTASVYAGALHFTGTTVNARRLYFFNNSAVEYGGAFLAYRSEEILISNLTCVNNTAEFGGCLRVRDTPLSLSSSVFIGNSVSNEGGGLSANTSTASIIGCLFRTNHGDFGGGLNLDIVESAEIRDTTIERNSASGGGGGAILRTGKFNIADCRFEANSCDNFGGGFTCGNDAVLNVSRSLFLSNVAESGGAGSNVIVGCVAIFSNTNWTSNRLIDGYGGGALVEGGRGVFEDSLFEQNVARDGAGVYVSSSSGTFRRIVLRNNNASVSGGGMRGFNGTVDVTDCHAERNEAEYGGAGYFSAGSDADIQRFVAVSNAASTSGGGLGVYESAASVAHSVFAQNSAEGNGGTLNLATTSTLELRNVTVSNSSSGSNGGVLYASSDSVVTIRHSNFRQSRATTFGGAIAVFRSRLFLQNTTVTNAQAENSGGALFLSNADVSINASHVSYNFAVQRGGGIFAIETTLMAETLFMQRNTADNGGGAIDFSLGNSTFELVNSTFVQNRGTHGGALVVDDGSAGQLIDAYAFNNSVSTNGGLAYVDNSNLTIAGGLFIENKASYGGDVVVVASGRLNVRDAEFRNGTATRTGGCISSNSGSIIVIQNTSISASEAGSGGAISLFQSHFWGHNLHVSKCKSSTDGGAMVANRSSSVLCSGCVFAENSAGSKGGGVYLESAKTQLLAFQFDNCSFEKNSAVLGGALHFVNEGRLTNCTELGANCTFVALRGSKFVQNEALSTGGAILSSDLDSIRVSCLYDTQSDPSSFMNRSQFEALPVLNSLDNICPSWTGNHAKDYGGDLASYARRVRKTIRFEEKQEELEVEGNIYFLQNHLSGSQLPSLFLTVVDALGQGPATGSGNETIEATMQSPDGLFTGSVRIHLEDGAGNFSGISGYRQPGFYEVRVEFNERSIPSFTILVEVRGCVIGEAAVANGTICQRCSGDSFNFHPEKINFNCKPCPEEAKCDTTVILPRKGHWHGSPCSSNIQECLTRTACDEEGRDQKLKDIGLSVQDCSFSDQFIENYTSAECNEGYRGPLCGSCESGFGRSRSLRCEPCFAGFGNFVLILLSIVVLLLLSSFTIRSSLPSHRWTERKTDCQNNKATPCSGRPSTSSNPANSQTDQMRSTERPPRGAMKGTSGRQTQSLAQTDKNLVELTKWKAVEIFKITVNFLQVIAIAIAVNVNWTETLIAVFETAEFIGGVTSEAATRSVDCLISSDSPMPRSAIRTVVNVMVPMLVTAFYFVLWAFVLLKLQKTAEYLIKRCALSFMTVSYLSYIALTKTVVNVLSCVHVYDSVELEDDRTTSYWSVDTSLECYRGAHAVLAALIGWPTLILFSFGFPVAVAAVLINARNKDALKSELLFESMGFMYRAYSGKYVFWESVIMLRKAILAVVVVFSYSLGGNLQGVLSVCVLKLAVYFQIVCAPFRSEFEDLNNYEGLSLLVSSLTFVSGLFFNDNRTSHGIRILLTLLLVVANIGLLLFFVAMFWKTSAEYLRIVMDAEGMKYNPDKGPFYIVRTYLSSRLQDYSTRIVSRIQARHTRLRNDANV